MVKNKKCLCEGEAYEIIDVFGSGTLTDNHIDIEISQQELTERFQHAVETAKKMGSNISSDLLGDVGFLAAPKMTWEDFVAITIGNKKQGLGNNDWGQPKSRPLFYGQYIPKKKMIVFKLLVLVDRSSSIIDDDTNYAVSQIQVLDSSIEGYVVCFDTMPHYKDATYIESGKVEELLKIKYTGSGGTMLQSTLLTYEKELGFFDMVVILTDGDIFDLKKINETGPPNVNTDFLWLLTKRNPSFNVSFGRVFNLKN